MLNAVLSGKAKRLDTGNGETLSWREVLRTNEDIITATLFERLTYLPGNVAWEILVRTFHLGLTLYRVARLERIEFWPRWSEEGDSSVEPDVFMRWSVGDPARRVDFVVEAKHGGAQYSQQWSRQQNAYASWSADDDVTVDETVFLAIGGAGENPQETANNLSVEVQQETGSKVKMKALAADWTHLAAALFRAKSQVSQPEVKSVINDMLEALAEFGYRHFELSSSLLSIEPIGDSFSDSLAALTRKRFVQ